MAATHFKGPIYVAGVEVIDENGNIDAPVTTTNLTTTGNTTIGNAATDTLDINATISDDFLVGTTKKIQFRDSNIYISSKDDGHLDLDADVSIDVNATVVSAGKIIQTPGTPITASANISSITSGTAILDSTGAVVTITCDAAGTAGDSIKFLIKAGPGTNNIVFDPGSFGYFAATTLSATTEIGKIITAISDGSKWYLQVGEDVHA
jgi:hypothetical protein